MTWAEKIISKRFCFKNSLKKISSQKKVVDDCFSAWDIAFYIVRFDSINIYLKIPSKDKIY
jgi:hypothetical protein